MDIITHFNWLDIVILLLVIRGIYLGVTHGLTSELFNFIGIVISLTLAIHWYSQVADVLIINFALPIWLSQLLCFFIIVQLTRLVFKYTIVLVLRILNVQFVPQLEKIGGGIIGFGRGVIIASVFILTISFFPSKYMQDSIHDRSFTGRFLVKVAERTYLSLIFWVPEEDREKAIFDISA